MVLRLVLSARDLKNNHKTGIFRDVTYVTNTEAVGTQRIHHTFFAAQVKSGRRRHCHQRSRENLCRVVANKTLNTRVSTVRRPLGGTKIYRVTLRGGDQIDKTGHATVRAVKIKARLGSRF